MLFQTLDNKNGCISYYQNGEFLEELNNNCKLTWRQNSRLANNDIDFAQIYVHGQDLDNVCPELLKEDWKKLQILDSRYPKYSTNVEKLTSELFRNFEKQEVK